MAAPTSITIEDGKSTKRKTYFTKFYRSNGNYIGTSDDVSFNSFRKVINGGLGELNLTLARPFDNFGEGDDIEFMNEVQLWIIDDESGADGQQIYSGFIDSYEPFVDSEKEGVNVNCLGYTTRLADIFYKNGTTISITKNATDPSDMIKDIVDRFRAEVSGSEDPRVNYTATSIENTALSASYTFVLKNCFESIQKARSFSPADWYWFVNADNELMFSSKPASPTHTFTFRKNVNLRVNKNIRDVKNRTVLWNGETGGGNLLRSYKDTTSVNAYGLRMAQRTDSRWANADTMDLVGNAFVEANKDPNIRVTLEVIDSNENDLGYNIELIEPGHTCQVLNLPTTSTTLGTNMTISTVTYELGKVTLELEELRQTLNKKFTDVIKELKQFVYNSNDAVTYTEV